MTQRLLVRHEVGDYSKWKSYFDSHKAIRAKNGFKNEKILRNVANQNDITVIFEVTDMAKANAFTKSNELKTALKEADVVGKPDLYFFSTK